MPIKQSVVLGLATRVLHCMAQGREPKALLVSN